MKEIEEQVLVATEQTVAIDDLRSQDRHRASESETNKGITVDIEIKTLGSAEAATSGENNTDTEHNYEYDVFISYNSHDRPWVRDVLLPTLERLGKKACVDYRDFSPGTPIAENISNAIQSSRVTIIVLSPSYLESQWCHYEIQQALAVNQGRVFPLILIECELPAILKHMTYLDTTCDDVQPYFIERLNEGLERADKWTVCYGAIDQETIESKVQNALTKRAKAAAKEATASINARRIKCCLSTPCTLLFIIFLFFFVFILAIFAQYISQPVPHREMPFENPNQAVIYLLPAIASCEALSIKSFIYRSPKFDIFLFAGRKEEFVKRVVESNVLNYTIHSKSYQSIEYNMVKGRSLESTFCFSSSNSTEDMRAYKLFDPDMLDFSRTWLYNYNSEYSFVKYRVFPRISKCSSLTINGTGSEAKQLNLVFANPGTSTVSVTVRNLLYKSSLNKRGSFKSCLNATSCILPFREPNYYVYIVANISDPDVLNDLIQVDCVARKATIAFFTLTLVAGVAVYIVLMKFCILGVCYKRVKHCYGSRIGDNELRKKFMEL